MLFHDVLDDGRRFRILTVVGDFARACLAIDVDTSIGGRRVAEVLQRLIDTRGKPAMLIIRQPYVWAMVTARERSSGSALRTASY